MASLPGDSAASRCSSLSSPFPLAGHGLSLWGWGTIAAPGNNGAAAPRCLGTPARHARKKSQFQNNAWARGHQLSGQWEPSPSTGGSHHRAPVAKGRTCQNQNGLP